MVANIEVKREAAESNLSLIRRFQKQLAAAGLLKKIKEVRYRERPVSHFKKKRWALKRLVKHAAIQRLKKLGQWESGK